MKSRHTLACLCGFLTVAAGLLPDEAPAQDRWQRRAARAPMAQSQPQPTPMLAVVGLREQRITIYDRTGARMLEAPVSSGTDGYETPPGVFSVVQKELEHHSNLYEDGSMPFMQRLTWTGIALHAGALPGYPASHGCIRLPRDFAERLYRLTNIGMRVVVAREGIAPVAIEEPQLFKRSAAQAQNTGALPVRLAGVKPDETVAGPRVSLSSLEARAAALSNAAEEAAQRARTERAAAARARLSAQPAERSLRQAEAALDKAEADLEAAEKVLAGGGAAKRLAEAEKAQAAAPERINAARAQLEKVAGNVKAKLDAAREAEERAVAAAAGHAKAVEAAEQAKQDMSPVSVFVSRKTQRVYVRKAFHPLWEGPVLMRDADKPIGTFVFTANEPAEGSRELRWSVVSLYRNPTAVEPAAPRAKGSKKVASPAELPLADAAAAQAALDRIIVPPEIAERISEVVLAGSSLVISDEPPSVETGKDTDFVVIMSGEPKGALTIRQNTRPARSYPDELDWGGGSPRGRRPSGGGGFGFWFN